MTIDVARMVALKEKLMAAGLRCEQDVWSNFMESLTVSALMVEVDSVKELQSLHKTIYDDNQLAVALGHEPIRLRAAAGHADKKQNCCCFFRSRQANRYNESYSFSKGSVADVIVRFSPNFTKGKMAVIEKGSSGETIVEVPAGAQILQLAEFLEKNKLSLETVSMIAYVSAVGLAMNAGHGTGRDAPGFAGLIEEITLITDDGKKKVFDKSSPNFETIRGAQASLFGTVVSMKIRCVDEFKLKETIHNYGRLDSLAADLPALMNDNEYFTLMHIPTYLPPQLDRSIENWHVRIWNKATEEKVTVKKAGYETSVELLSQELGAGLGAPVLDKLVSPDLKDLLPAYMSLIAKAVVALRAEQDEVGLEHHITHYQASFPKKLTDLSFLMPVHKDLAADLLIKCTQKIDKLLAEAAEHGEYPVTYAVYARYFKGTNGGLSTSHTDLPDDRIVALEMVSHPDAPGLKAFEQTLIAWLKKEGIDHRFHLGKDIPEGTSYADFIPDSQLAKFKEVLSRWYDGEEKVKQSSLVPPYFQEMLGLVPKPTLRPIKKELRVPQSIEMDLDYPGKLVASLDKWQAQTPVLQRGEFATALTVFKQMVKERQCSLEQRLMGTPV